MPDKFTLDEIFRLMEASALHDYPNPERVGCPPEETLTALARDPRSFDMDAPVFDHLAHCSPCFQFVRARRPSK
jgi:hypothetical protein